MAVPWLAGSRVPAIQDCEVADNFFTKIFFHPFLLEAACCICLLVYLLCVFILQLILYVDRKYLHDNKMLLNYRLFCKCHLIAL